MRLVWHYVLANQVRVSERSADQREALRHKTQLVIDKVRNETEWKTKKSALCDWCEFQPQCPLFGGAETEARMNAVPEVAEQRAAEPGPAPAPAAKPAPRHPAGPDGQLRLL